MGGMLFAAGPDPLYTPRMPPAVYYAVRARCHAQLRPLFAAVATPIDGPAKADYGDIDIMAAVPEPGGADVPEVESDPADPVDPPTEADPADAEALFGPLLRAAAARLGAVRAEYVPRLGRVSVAVRWEGGVAADVDAADAADKGAPHIQVDLTLCPSRRRLRWALFRHAHGDLWNILSVAALQPAGLTADDRALWLRVPEIEAHDRRRARVFLTDVPAAVLAFLGLAATAEAPPADPNAGPDDDGADLGVPWTGPFPSAAALFAYVAASRFYAPRFDATDARSKDRRRLRLRPLFRQWVEERGADRADDEGRDVRAAAREAAFAAFPHARPRYEAVRAAWLREQHATAVRAAAKDAVPKTLPPAYRGAVLGAVRQQLFGTATASSPGPGADLDPYAPWTVDSVAAWVAAHWRELGAATAPALHAAYERDES